MGSDGGFHYGFQMLRLYLLRSIWVACSDIYGSGGVLVNGIEVSSESSVSVIHKFFVNGQLEDLADNLGYRSRRVAWLNLGVQVGESIDYIPPQ